MSADDDGSGSTCPQHCCLVALIGPEPCLVIPEHSEGMCLEPMNICLSWMERCGFVPLLNRLCSWVPGRASGPGNDGASLTTRPKSAGMQGHAYDETTRPNSASGCSA